MKGFEYGLENVLKLRNQREDESLSAFSKAQREHLECQSGLERLESEIDSTLTSLQGVAPGEIAARRSHDQYMEHLRLKKEHQKNLLQETGRRCESRRRDLEQARMNRKALETHRDKQLGVFKEEQRKKEERQLDELAVTAFKRRRGL